MVGCLGAPLGRAARFLLLITPKSGRERIFLPDRAAPEQLPESKSRAPVWCKILFDISPEDAAHLARHTR